MTRRTVSEANRLIVTLSALLLGISIGAGAAQGRTNTDHSLPQGPTTAGISPSTAPVTPALDMMTTKTVATGLFGSVAFPFKPGGLVRWREVSGATSHLAAVDCAKRSGCQIRVNLLRETLAATEGKPLVGKIEALNVAVNKLVTYGKDIEVHGKFDYWATPSEILTSGKGDCEDYAILKFAALRQAGVPADSMKLVILREAKRNFYHAVLAVSVGGKTYVLDNLSNKVLTDRQLPQYQALYSLGKERAWIHGYKRGSEYAMQKRPASLEAVQPGEGIPAVF